MGDCLSPLDYNVTHSLSFQAVPVYSDMNGNANATAAQLTNATTLPQVSIGNGFAVCRPIHACNRNFCKKKGCLPRKFLGVSEKVFTGYWKEIVECFFSKVRLILCEVT